MVLRFAVLGGLGFGILGIFPFGFSGFFISGALGGFFLALPLRNVWVIISRTVLMSLGFGVGSIAGFFVVMTVWDPVGIALIGICGGAAGGMSLGISTRKLPGILLLTLIGTVGFGAGAWVYSVLSNALYGSAGNLILPQWSLFVLNSVSGAIGGASLGATLGFLQRRSSG